MGKPKYTSAIFTSLVSRPLPFSPSVCVHDNTRKNGKNKVREAYWSPSSGGRKADVCVCMCVEGGGGDEGEGATTIITHQILEAASLMPRPLPRKAERGSGVLSDISCHIGRGRMR